MIGIVVVTHGNMASGVLDSAKLIAGEQENITSEGLFEGDDIGEFKERIRNAVDSVHTGEGVLVFVDLFGASPFTTTGSLISYFKEKEIDVRVVAGCNLPMVIEATLMRESLTLDELYTQILQTGKDSIVELREALGL